MATTNVTDKALAGGSGKDKLGMSEYASSLVKYIQGADTPFTIAIQGEWGSGKTSLMREICHELCGDLQKGKSFIKDDDKPFCGVWLDTWECALMRSPQDVQLQVISSMAEAVGGVTGNKRKLLAAARKAAMPLFHIAALALGGYVGRRFTDGLSQSIPDKVRELIPWFSSDGQGIKEFRSELCKAIEVIKKRNDKNNNSAQSNNDEQPKPKGIIFFIDDLDRIDPAIAVQILEILKNLFEVEGCTFVLSIDYDVVVKGLKKKFGDYDIKKDHEFRRFFDKIIQLPFSMPVSGYEIGGFLGDMLAEVGYYPKTELESTVLDRLQQMAKLSTAKNPRSVKRLVNSLSLIKTILDEKKKTLTEAKKQLCFGVVCVQIAYPHIYNMLVAQPDFVKKWDGNFARSQGLSLPDKAPEDMANPADWDGWEDWRRIAYMAAQNAPWMKERFFDIGNLLQLLPACVPEGENFGDMMREVLAFAATTGTSALREQKNFLSRDEFLARVEDKTVRERLEKLFAALDSKFVDKGGALLDMEYQISMALVKVMYPLGSVLLLEIRPDGRRALPFSDDSNFTKLEPLKEGEEQPSSTLFDALVTVYNKLADKSHQLPST